MAKRRADKQITHDNYDEEEVPEEPGEFEKASDDVIARRVIKKAKRNLTTNNEGVPRASPFAGFSFYGNGNSATTTPTSTPADTAPIGPAYGIRNSDEYLNKVAKLNRDILSCISRLVDNGAYLSLIPCFDDYIQHFQRLTREEEDRQRKNNNGTLTNSPSTATTAFEASKQTFNFTAPNVTKPSVFAGNSSSTTFKFDAPIKDVEKNTSSTSPTSNLACSSSAAPTFSFGSTPAKAGTATSPASFMFGQQTSSKVMTTEKSSETVPQVFSSGIRPTFSFSIPSQPAPIQPAPATNDDEDEPPPREDIAPIDEVGSLYTKKVKLFYKKKEAVEKGLYADKGVGFLHIKELNAGNYQLLVRAQTTLGNVLLNIRLGKDLPVNRVGKNNVAIMCVPNPPLNLKDESAEPTMFLIRVKNAEDADELRDKLIEFKQKAKLDR